jgi:hypothetical protein
VNIAARLQALAEPGGVCVSGSATIRSGKLPLAPLCGEQTVKNIASRYAPIMSAAAKAMRCALRCDAPGAEGVAALGLAIVVAIACAVVYLWPRALEQSAVANRNRIAVLPFANVSADPRTNTSRTG